VRTSPSRFEKIALPWLGLPTLRVGSRFPNIWNPVDIGAVPVLREGTAGSFNLSIGYYLNTVEAVKADGEPELLSAHVIFDTP
jgi:hypothetical protein